MALTGCLERRAHLGAASLFLIQKEMNPYKCVRTWEVISTSVNQTESVIVRKLLLHRKVSS